MEEEGEPRQCYSLQHEIYFRKPLNLFWQVEHPWVGWCCPWCQPDADKKRMAKRSALGHKASGRHLPFQYQKFQCDDPFNCLILDRLRNEASQSLIYIVHIIVYLHICICWLMSLFQHKKKSYSFWRTVATWFQSKTVLHKSNGTLKLVLKIIAILQNKLYFPVDYHFVRSCRISSGWKPNFGANKLHKLLIVILSARVAHAQSEGSYIRERTLQIPHAHYN